MLFAGNATRSAAILAPRPAPLTSAAMASAGAAAGTASLHEQRSLRAREAFAELPDATSARPADLDATFQVRLGDVGRTWEVRAARRALRGAPVAGARARRRHRHRRRHLARRCARAASRASTRSRSAASTRAATSIWRSASRACSGSPAAATRCCGSPEVETARGRVSTPDRRRRARAGDLPARARVEQGLVLRDGRRADARPTRCTRSTCRASALSSKPARGAYDAPWFADAVLGYMDAMAIDRAHLVGNSMGGRVAIEVALSRRPSGPRR